MDYKTIAQAILAQSSAVYQPPRSRSFQSDDERLAQVIWRRMQLEMNLDQPKSNHSSLLV